MQLKLNRAQQRFLGLVGGFADTPDDAVQPIHLMSIDISVTATLQRWCEASGKFQGGALYGQRRGDRVLLLFVSRNGYPHRIDERDPLSLDEAYILGYTDCLAAFGGKHYDWVGQWMVYPDRMLPNVSTDLAWLHRAAGDRLVDDLNILLVAGWHDHRLTLRGYGYDHHTSSITSIQVADEHGKPFNE